MSQIIGVLSGKGGVGKTTVVTNIAASLINDFGRRVVILDSNMGSSHLGLHLGIYEDPPITIREIVKKRLPVIYGVYVHPATGIRIIPAPLASQDIRLTPQTIKKFAKMLESDYEMVIVDCPPGMGKDTISAVSAMDAGIVVTAPDFPSVTDALKTVNLLQRMKKRVVGIIVNRVRGESYELGIQEIESTCGVRVIGVIPEDRRVPEGISSGMPVVAMSPNSRSSVALRRTAANLIGESYREAGLISRIVGALSARRPNAHYGRNAIEPANRSLVEG